MGSVLTSSAFLHGHPRSHGGRGCTNTPLGQRGRRRCRMTRYEFERGAVRLAGSTLFLFLLVISVSSRSKSEFGHHSNVVPKLFRIVLYTTVILERQNDTVKKDSGQYMPHANADRFRKFHPLGQPRISVCEPPTRYVAQYSPPACSTLLQLKRGCSTTVCRLSFMI
jgi:hypothetical protein